MAGPPSLRRTLGLFRVSLTGIGVILGAGVYALIGPAAAKAGNAMWLAFVLAGATASLTAYSYARFATLRPKDSPEFHIVVTTAIYVLVAFSASAAVGWRDLSGSAAPLALVARQSLGSRADTVLSFVALCATANTVLLLLLSAARSVYGMAAAGMLPRVLAMVSRKTATPVVATWVVVGITAPFVLLGDLARVAAMTDAAVLLSFLMVNLALVWVSARRAIDRRPGDLVIPTAASLLCAWLLTHTGWPGLGTAGVEFVARLQPPRGGQVTLVRVLEPLRVGSIGLMPAGVRGGLARRLAAARDEQAQGARRDLTTGAGMLRRAGWGVRSAIQWGIPVDELLAAVHAADAHVLVVGARGTGGVARLLLGSVAEGALSRARLPVLVVR